MAPNRFNGLLPVDQTVETVIAVGSLFFTGLKPDVNEKHRRRYEMSRPRSRSQDGFLRHSRSALGFLLILIFCIASQSATADSAGLSVQVDQPGVAISSNLFGIFFEEINSAGDGGIYAELIRNRSFEDSTASPVYWTQLTTGTASGALALDTSLPLSATNLQSLRLTMSSGVGTVSAANSGYWGIPVTSGATYQLGFNARAASGFGGVITASLTSTNGALYSQVAIGGLTTNWQHFSRVLSPNTTDPAARLALSLSQTGTVWLDFVSLFPAQTFNNRTNGLRPDLANMLVNLQPSFVRFPGGSWVDGTSLANAYHWEPTVGEPANRLPRNNLWGYMVDNGLGYHEYLQMCEDIGAQPLFVINCGMDVNQNAVPTNQLASWVQEALDAVQYANGDITTYWGSQRAANGHPAPFDLQYMEIGNENGGAAYNANYSFFYDALKAAYPYLHIIANSWGGIPNSRPVEIMDEHYYSDPNFFINNATKYDSYNRNGPKVYVGEYAVTSGGGNGNLMGALGEAAFMTGLERNSDIVSLASYAPLFANLNNKNWNPDLIYFTGTQVYGTPSYYAQQMFSRNRGDVVLPVSLSITNSVVTNIPPHGAIGLGSWNTSVQYSNIVVTSNGVTLYQSDFVANGTNGWRVYNGAWGVSSGSYQQTALSIDCRSTTGNTNWSNYTITLRARKNSGSEGFLIMFNWLDDNNWTWWNIGGWNNTLGAIERMVNGSKSLMTPQISSTVQTGAWYDLRIILSPNRVQCYLNGTLVHDALNPNTQPHGAIGLAAWNTQNSFTNVVVTNSSGLLYQSDFSGGAPGWQVFNGTWTTSGGVYQQTANTIDCRSNTGDTNWSNYTITLRARKDSGSEGFLIMFDWLDNNNWTWWNIGGWNNTQHAIEQSVNGVSGSVQPGRWYDIRIVLTGNRIQCFLDGQLIHDVSYNSTPSLLASASYLASRGQIIVKAVNVTSQSLPTQFALNSARGISANATVTVLTSGNPTDENSLAQPTKVAPVTNLLSGIGTNLAYTFPAYSLAIFRFQALPDYPVGLSFGVTNQQDLATISNGVPVHLSSFITNTVSVNYVIDTPSGIIASGTLQFLPGDLTRTIFLPDTPNSDIVRVTLSNPTNGQLSGASRVYYVRSLNGPTEPPVLAWARFPDEFLLYWSDTTAGLISCASLNGPWPAVTNAISPFKVIPFAPKQFYRLKR
jgi:alpha-L-arabinofuranosidase